MQETLKWPLGIKGLQFGNFDYLTTGNFESGAYEILKMFFFIHQLSCLQNSTRKHATTRSISVALRLIPRVLTEHLLL
jgi:hypothetical protein